MRRLAAALLLSCAAPVAGQHTGEVRRGDMALRVRASGTVLSDGHFRLKSTIQGRVEAVLAKNKNWYSSRDILGVMANKDLAAMIDYRGSTAAEIIGSRWRKIYRPTSISCPKYCYLLKSYIKPKQWVRPHAILFEAATNLRMVGEVQSRHASLIRFGQWLEFWPLNDPKRRMRQRIANLKIDRNGTHATFSMNFTRKRYLDVGTRWEGVIVPAKKKNVVMVPTEAIIVHEGAAYIPIRVSTGAWTAEMTEILDGVKPEQLILLTQPRQELTVPAPPGEMKKRKKTKAPRKKKRAKKKKKRTVRDPLAPLEDPYAE